MKKGFSSSNYRKRVNQHLLLPANPKFIWGSILVAWVLQMALTLALGRKGYWLPDVLAVVIVFWCIHQPRRVGIVVAFCAGLTTDLYQYGLLGQHALGYVLLAYFAHLVHRRILWFTTALQAVNLLPAFIVVTLLYVAVRLISGGIFPGWEVFLSPLWEMFLWPIVSYILLFPQRLPPDPDKHRPI